MLVRATPVKLLLYGRANKKYCICSGGGLNFSQPPLFLYTFDCHYQYLSGESPMQIKPLQSFVLCCILIANGPSRAQGQIASLLTRYRDHRPGDTVFLKAVDSVARRLLSNDSIPLLVSA